MLFVVLRIYPEFDCAPAEHMAGDLAHVSVHPTDRDSEGIETMAAVAHSEWQTLNLVASF